jgi:predicted N-acetyltransferase YhbS
MFVQGELKVIDIIQLRDNPNLLDQGAKFFHASFGSEGNYMLYYDCIKNSLTTESLLPRWFLAMKGKEVVGGCGLITNDFISRMDLWPWLAALYVIEQERGQALGSRLLSKAVEEARKLGFRKVYLTTDHDGYYEKYGWQRIEDGYMVWGDRSKIYEIDAVKDF